MAALTAGAALLQAGGSLMEGLSASRSLRSQARAEESNAVMALVRGKQKEDLIRRRARRHLGKVRAAAGKAGVRMTGSPIDAIAASAAEFEIDAMNARFNAEAEAQQARTRAKAARKKAKRSVVGAAIKTGTALLL